MEFMINSCFRVLQSPPEKELIQAGVYRVLLDDLRQNITCAALIFPEGDAASRPKVGRPSKPSSHRLHAPKKPPQPLVGKLSWFDRDLLLWMHKMEHLIPFSVHPRVIASYAEKKPAEHSAAVKLYVARVERMRLFLDIQHLQESIVVYQGHIETGKLKAIAVSSAARNPMQPTVQTINESGVVKLDLESWFGYFAPGKTPPEALERLRAELAKIIATPELQETFRKAGGTPMNISVADTRTMLARDVQRWTGLIRAANISLD